MIDIKYIREHTDQIIENSRHRGVTVDIDRLLELDERRRELVTRIQDLQAQRNATSKTKPSEEEIAQMRRVGSDITNLEKDLAIVESEYRTLLLQVPNLTHPDTPIGGEDAFHVVMEGGVPPKFDFPAKDHEQLFRERDMVDFERGSKVAGAKFYFTKGGLVRLNQALLAYGMDVAVRHGFVLMETPDVAKDKILQGIGFNPRGPETQVYSIENADLSLIGTAEITVGGYHADEILDLSDGPKKYAAISHCFRTEAGTYGRESKGLYRVHQFTKLELFVFCTPEKSEEMHQEILAIEREIVDGLKLPYRVIDIASGDLGGPAYRKYDIEAWMVMKDGYGEITSTSNCTDYQARRLNIRYRKLKTENSKLETEFVHTLNGTAIVTSRLPIAIAENYQNIDGSITIPEVLRPFMGGAEKI